MQSGGWSATRVLCCISVSGYPALVGLVIGSQFAWVVADGPNSLVSLLLFLWLLVTLLTGIILRLRECEVCEESLFPTTMDVVGNKSLGMTPRARRLMGSYARRVRWDMARTGVLRCVWCAHEQGSPPDIVIRRR